jgi:4-hydroxy-3-methylbut-2-enyl diphosphate reductase
MKIILATHFGLCFGVRDAIAHAHQIARNGPLTILGQLVHNPVVREQLRQIGVEEASLDDDASKSKRVMITAHGASERQRRKWITAGYQVDDATCPLVQHAHQQLKQLVAAGYFPVVIGKPGHVEVRGLTEDFEDSFVIEQLCDVAELPQHLRYGVIAQTTQPIDHVHRLVEAIRSSRPDADVRFIDTVCRPTKERQVALRNLIMQADVIVVVGGHSSNNTRQLVQTCRSAGKAAFHVERPEELRPEWFIDINIVGLTAGTSTLPETVNAVARRLEEISSTQANQTKTNQ